MKRLIVISAAVAVMALMLSGMAVAMVSLGLTLTVTPSSAPNVYGSPSWDPYVGNALYAIENGLSAYGTPGQPTYYSGVSLLTREQNVVTGFNSWNGVANPAAPFAGELGNRLHFGLHVMGYGTKFKLGNLSFLMSSTWSVLDGWADNFFSPADVYSAKRVGIDYGADGVKGTADDIVYSNGEAATNAIDELIYVGAGDAPPVYDTSAFPGGTLQEKIDNFVSTIPQHSITMTYTMWNDAHDSILGENSATVQVIPEPGSIIALITGFIGLGFLRRRK